MSKYRNTGLKLEMQASKVLKMDCISVIYIVYTLGIHLVYIMTFESENGSKGPKEWPISIIWI
uniref:Uncharacterized protein n=1 Tax=Solanum tuberosum TaxID=4113 RepID=M1AN47_SOLTU